MVHMQITTRSYSLLTISNAASVVVENELVPKGAVEGSTGIINSFAQTWFQRFASATWSGRPH